MISAAPQPNDHAVAPDRLGHPQDTTRDSDEQALLRALRSGEEEAFARLVRLHQRGMMRVASAYVADRTVAEEVVQETWLAVVCQIGEFEGRSTVKTWIFRILVNKAQRRGGREHRIVPFSALGRGDDPRPLESLPGGREAWATVGRPWLDPQRRVEALEARRVMRAALQTLPARQQIVVALRDVEGFDADEVARALGVSAGNQRLLLHRARARLRVALDALNERGATHPAIA